MILDEPAAALGVRQTEIVLQFIEQLKQHGVAVIFISHNMQHVLRVADRIVVMRLGEKVFDGPRAEVDRRGPGGADDRRPAQHARRRSECAG